jgi:hypothetical protein
MDIEGAEVFALAGMERLLQTQKPIIFLEYHQRFVISLDPAGEERLNNLLTRFDYRIYDNYGRECPLTAARVILATPARAENMSFDVFFGAEFMQKFRAFFGFVEKMKNTGKNILIYGGGSIGKTVAALMPENTVCLVDAASNIQLLAGEKVDSGQVYSSNSIPLLDFDYILVTTLGYEDEVVADLKQRHMIAPEKIINLSCPPLTIPGESL